jgi:integrase
MIKEPIKNKKDIQVIKKLLSDHPRNFAIFTFGINTNLRAGDLLKIKIKDVRYLKPGDQFNLVEIKTKKKRTITINNTVYEAIQNLLRSMKGIDDNDYLFQSQKGKGMITVTYLNSLVKSWCEAINLKGNYGGHTLRKTFGFMHRTEFNTDIPTLMTMFNHNTQLQTLTYLCIQPEEIKDAYLCEI